MMQVRVESGDASVAASRWDNVLLVAAGTDPYDLVDVAVSAAAEMSGASWEAIQACAAMALL